MKNHLRAIGLVITLLMLLIGYLVFQSEGVKKISFQECKKIGGTPKVIFDLSELKKLRESDKYLGDIYPQPQSPAFCVDSKSESMSTSLSTTDDSKDVGVSPEEAGFVGKWKVAGNDFEYTSVVLGSDGSFVMNGYFLQNSDNPYEFTGSWKITQKSGERYLILMLDKPTVVPSTEESIERYKSWGQEFVGNSEFHLKITTNNGITTFRYDGNLMLKAD